MIMVYPFASTVTDARKNNCLAGRNLLQCHDKRQSGFDRKEIQGYLDLYAFVLNPPSDKLEKVDILLNLVFQNPKILRYRDMYAANKGFSD